MVELAHAPRQQDLTAPELLVGGDRGSLLIHGFTGSPWELRYLGHHMSAAGWSANIVRLAGHGTSPEEMEPCDWIDWYASARGGLEELESHSTTNAVVGMSMGSLLALKLAAEEPHRVRALVLLAPALMTSMSWLPWVAPLIPAALALSAGRLRFLPKGESDIADDEARRECPSYTSTPLRSVGELVQLQQHVRGLLPQIRQPVLVIHSSQDHTCPLENVAILQKELPGPVRTLILRDSYHVISADRERERVADEVLRFAVANCATTSVDIAPHLT